MHDNNLNGESNQYNCITVYTRKSPIYLGRHVWALQQGSKGCEVRMDMLTVQFSTYSNFQISRLGRTVNSPVGTDRQMGPYAIYKELIKC